MTKRKTVFDNGNISSNLCVHGEDAPWAKEEAKTRFDSVLEDMFSGFFGFGNASPITISKQALEKSTYPKVNVINLDDKVLIRAAVPGMKKEDVSVEISHDNVMTISGSANQEEEYKNYYSMKEIKQTAFSRTFKLAKTLDTSTVSAECKDGILSIEIKKFQNEVVRQVKKVNIS